jgi:DNA-binding response OmpR family regulator
VILFCLDGMQKPVKSKVMTVDDELDVTVSLKRALQESGLFDVDAFTDPQQAYSSFTRGKYDLVILDIRMPRIDGFDFYRKIRAVDKDVSVCFLTAVNDFNDYRAMYPDIVYKVENDDDICIIDKPIGSKRLIEKINRMLKISKER